MMKLRSIKFLLFGISFLLAADAVLAALADKKVEAESFFLSQRIKDATLGLGYSERLDSQTDAVFYYYTYKTCFIRRTQRGVANWSYRFVYARPFPIFLSFMNEFRFEMIGTGTAKFVIFSDGTINIR